jgi:CheY-like chemotaxis protein
MPEMDGLTLAQRIRQEHGTVPILLLTSVDHLGLPSPQIPIDAHLTKPVKHSQLYNTLLSVLQGAAPQQPQPDPFRWDRPMALTHPLRILVAEDNPINQRVALMMLERLGYRADVVGNGLEVLAALQRQPYDVILMDLQMPDMDGLAASRCLRQTGCPPTQPWIIALTAHAFQDARDEAEAAGMNDYLSKPIRMNDLALALQKVTSIPVDRQSLQPPPPAEAQTEPTLDPEAWQSLKAAIGLDSLPLLQEIIDNYLSDSQQRIQTLTTAYQQGNGLLLSRTAHSLLGSSSNLGAVRLTTLCRQVVTLCKTDSLPAALPEILEQIRQESLRVASALQQERSRW